MFPLQSSIIPGPPFLFGACSVLLALLVALFIPEHPHMGARAGSWKKHTSPHGHPHSPHPPGEAKEPLLQDTNVWLGVLMWLNWPHPLFPIEERTAHGGSCHLLKRKAISEARSVLNLELYLSAVFSLNTPELVHWNWGKLQTGRKVSMIKTGRPCWITNRAPLFKRIVYRRTYI